MEINISPKLKGEFPGLRVKTLLIHDIRVKRENIELEAFKTEVIREIRKDHNITTLKDAPLIRMYRDFFWRIGIDPTKTRPASEALIRRVLKDRPLPKINTLVDSYNLASMKTNISLAAFDNARLQGELNMRSANPGEDFLGIGMKEPITLKGNEPIITDQEKIIAVYPYRDSDSTKVTIKTKDTLILVCGVPGVTEVMLNKTAKIAYEHVTRFCGGNSTPEH